MKNSIRLTNKKIRSEMSESDIKLLSKASSEIFLSSEMYHQSKCIMIYMPIKNEVDTSFIMSAALSDGKTVISPATDKDSNTIIPLLVTKDTKFESGDFSIAVPKVACIADKSEIDLVIVPGIAFDKDGNRIGFGKGYYDRFLTNLSALKIGLCYDFQVSDKIISEKNDIPMDYIITEKEIICCKNNY